jgi:hypothetical protein
MLIWKTGMASPSTADDPKRRTGSIPIKLPLLFPLVFPLVFAASQTPMADDWSGVAFLLSSGFWALPLPCP